MGHHLRMESVGTVREFNAEEGWGVIDSPDVRGGCFVHYSSIEMPDFQALEQGQRVSFSYENPGFLQDGCPHRALAVRPL